MSLINTKQDLTDLQFVVDETKKAYLRLQKVKPEDVDYKHEYLQHQNKGLIVKGIMAKSYLSKSLNLRIA
jgi:hypothetical protein